MKAKHIITTCGVILGGLAVAGSASAVVTYKGSSDVQFTFSPMLSLELSGDGFNIDDLVPGGSRISNAVDVTVASNSSSGYILTATVGNSTTFSNTDLTSSNSRIAMIGASDTALSAGKWGYTINDGTTYGALALYSAITPTTIKTSTASGSEVTSVKIGAYADSQQLPGEYNNVVNFAVVSAPAGRTITLLKNNDTAVSSVAINSGGTIGSYSEGDILNISATCATGYTFSNWSKSADFGTIASDTSATTTYTVGNGDVSITANCN